MIDNSRYYNGRYIPGFLRIDIGRYNWINHPFTDKYRQKVMKEIKDKEKNHEQSNS